MTVPMRALGALSLLALASLPLHAQEPVRVFELKDQDGNVHRIGGQKGLVVLEWTNKDCPFVRKHYAQRGMQELARKYMDQRVTWISIDSTPGASPEQVKRWHAAQEIGYPILLDPDGEVARAFGAATTPHVFVLEDGEVVYQGAVDDQKPGTPATVNFVANALDALLAEREVKIARTEPYGTPIKYPEGTTKPGEDYELGQWLSDYEKALGFARKSKRPVLVDFTGSDWCGWCIKLKSEVFDTDAFRSWASRNVILLEIDFPKLKQLPDDLRKQNEELKRRFDVKGFPTVVFLDGRGEEIARTGYRDGGPKAWIEHVESLLKESRPAVRPAGSR